MKTPTLTIDFGSYYTKSAYEGPNKVPEMAINTYSKRLTPTFLAFKTPKEFDNRTNELLNSSEIESLIPVIGDLAYSKLISQPWSGAGYLPTYIDLDTTETRNLSEKLFAFPPCDNRFKTFNITASFLHFYGKMILSEDFYKTRVNFVVPGSFTEPQIHELHDLAAAAKLQNETITWDWEAVANYFAQRRPDVIQPDNRIGLFIDIGATSSKAYALKFEEQKGVPKYIAKLLTYQIDYDAGGAYLTADLAKFVKNKITNKQISLSEMGRIIEQCEKAKRILSLVPDTRITIENVSGSDHSVRLTQADMQEVAKPQVLRTIKLIQAAYKKDKVDFVEVIGGGSRALPIRDAIMKVIGSNKLNSSMNVDEALAMGGEYQILTNWVQGQMNDSIHSISLCAALTCHSLMIGTSHELGFHGNPELVYFNITSPLRRGLRSYNWTYYVPRPGYGLTNYFFYSRGPIRLENVLACYLGDCKKNTATLLRPLYGIFVPFLEAVANDRKNLQYQTNKLEEMYNIAKSASKDAWGMSDGDVSHIKSVLTKVEDYLFNNNFNIENTTNLIDEIEGIQHFLVKYTEFLLSKDKLAETIQRANVILEVTYPKTRNWLEPKIYEAFMEKTRSTQKYFNEISERKVTKFEIDEAAASLDAWCDALPPVPKKAIRGKLISIIFEIVDRIINSFVAEW